MIGGVPGIQPARIVLIGGGIFRAHAARMAAGLRAKIIILNRSIPRLSELDELFQRRARTRSSKSSKEEVFAADAARQSEWKRVLPDCRAIGRRCHLPCSFRARAAPNLVAAEC